MQLFAKTLALPCSALLLLSLTGCAPHPASGVWATPKEPDSGFDRLEVTYEGHAQLYTVGEKEAGRHCFWGGESKQSIVMTCKPASNLDTEERYHLIVNADGSATLTQDGKEVAKFTRQAQQASGNAN